jgi:hypothetical protein
VDRARNEDVCLALPVRLNASWLLELWRGGGESPTSAAQFIVELRTNR